MASVNKVILVGNLGRDPEVRYSSEGAAICNISIATTSQWKDRNSGEKREETEWHRVVIYNRLAEIAGEYLKKGRSVYIEGRIKTRKFQDKSTGEDRYSTEIVAQEMQMIGGPVNSSEQAPSSEPKAKSNKGRSGKGKSVAPHEDDDIPFD